MKVGLYGRLGGGNIGNDAMLDAVLEYLRTEQPQAELDFMCEGPEAITRRYGVPAVHMHWMQSRKPARSRIVQKALTLLRIPPAAIIDTWRTARWVRKHDVVMIPGAGVLEGTLPERPWELPYTMLVMAACGRLFGVKTALVCVGGSKVEERGVRVLLRTAAKLVDYRSFRDEYSLGVGRETGVAAPQDKAFADLAFALPVEMTKTPEPKSVGVGVMAYYGSPADRPRADEVHEHYVDQMQQFVRLLVESGRTVRLLVGDRLDEEVADAVVADARTYWTGPGQMPVSYEPFTSFDGLMDQVAAVQTVVAMRYHCVVAGLKMGRPTLAIAYGRKHDALMGQMGVAEYVQDVKALDLERLVEQVGELEADEARIVQTLADHATECRVRLDAGFADLTAVLFAPATESVR
ncbi:polysaccharide pyruvyl transferase family protein [Kribbella sp. NPDC026611]|uniref:polysaccharide pyruvyl transferase family protein n=1 Tax=Kribbella sp. NPDC026611 TaxID=3154911 RepID=UPI0033EC5872